MGAREGFVGCCADDEGLVDLGTEEGAVAIHELGWIRDGKYMEDGKGERLPKDMEGSEISHF